MENKEERRTFAKRVIAVSGVIIAAMIAVGIWFIVNSSSCSRQVSRWESEYGYGVDREVTLYSATGEEIGHWEGKIDVAYTTSRIDLLFFDEDGNVIDRVIITPGSGTLVIDQK